MSGGAIYLAMGPSGAGHSTLLRFVTSDESYFSGREGVSGDITLNGEPLTPALIRAHVALNCAALGYGTAGLTTKRRRRARFQRRKHALAHSPMSPSMPLHVLQ